MRPSPAWVFKLVAIWCYAISATTSAPVTEHDTLTDASIAGVNHLTPRVVPADPISKYTTAYFTSVFRGGPNVNIENACVFWSGPIMAVKARKFTATTTAFTLFDTFPCDLFEEGEEDDNPLRDIMADASDRRTYFDNMARSFAQHCSGTAFLMTAAGGGNVDATSVWTRVEAPVLKAVGSGCSKIQNLNDSGNPTSILWERSGTSKRDGSTHLQDLAVRDNVQTCDTDENLAKVEQGIMW